MKESKIIAFDNGFNFFRDLLCCYGKEQAVKIANDYLDMQIKNTDPEEHQFCCELYHAVKRYTNQ